jgi:hypothetical protein
MGCAIVELGAWEMRESSAGFTMPVFQLGGRGFEAADVRAICDAFDSAWAAVIQGSSVDPKRAPKAREALASQIIELAKVAPGPLDASALRDEALAYFRNHPLP